MTNSKDSLLEKLADGVMAMRDENNNLKQQNEELIEKLAGFEIREMAESILLQARQKEGAPGTLITKSIEDFMDKRAQLERKGSQEIEKVATLLEYIAEGDGISLSDREDKRAASTDPLGDWLRGEVEPSFY
jgi:hypothetical protein